MHDMITIIYIATQMRLILALIWSHR